jgi:zinc protease
MIARCSRVVVLFVVIIILSVAAYSPGRAQGSTSRVQRFVLPNGLVILLAEDHSLPFVSMRLLVDAGSRSDPRGQEGVARLTARGVLTGTPGRSASAISRELDYMGATLNSSTTRDFSSFNLRVLKRELDRGFGLLFESLTRPVFPEDEFKREMERTLSGITQEEDSPGRVVEKEFHKVVYLNTPYGHPVEGTQESLRSLDRDKAAAFYKACYQPNRAILAITGDITLSEVNERLVPYLAKWERSAVQPALSEEWTYGKGPKTVTVNKSISQANIIMGNKGISRTNPDYYAVTVMNYILGGGGFTSRLMESIRNKRGLAYSVSSGFEAGQFPGTFQVSLQTKNASAREAMNLVFAEMERIRKELVTPAELEGARKYLVGSFPMRLDTQAKMVQFILLVEFYGLGLDYAEKYPALINAVTREDILRAASLYLDPKDPIVVIVANLKEAGIE